DIRVHVQKRGALIRVDVEMTVPASAQEVWDVLTDYEHMAQFVSNVRSSEVLNRDTDRLEVAQKSATTFGLLHFAFDNVRRIEMTPPREIHSQVTSGDMNGSAFTTRISDDGATTRVVNHGDFVPTLWIPP